jgi:hypothetical protein
MIIYIYIYIYIYTHIYNEDYYSLKPVISEPADCDAQPIVINKIKPVAGYYNTGKHWTNK